MLKTANNFSRISDDLRRLQLDLFELSRPYVRLKCAVLERSLPQFLIKDGAVEVVHAPEVTEALRQIDELERSVIASFLISRELLEGGTKTGRLTPPAIDP